MPVSGPIPRTSKPSRAVTTVRPANTTARPEVSSARTAASSGDSPALMPPRWRVTMNKA